MPRKWPTYAALCSLLLFLLAEPAAASRFLLGPRRAGMQLAARAVCCEATHASICVHVGLDASIQAILAKFRCVTHVFASEPQLKPRRVHSCGPSAPTYNASVTSAISQQTWTLALTVRASSAIPGPELAERAYDPRSALPPSVLL